MAKFEPKRFLFAFTFALLAGGIAAVAYLNRDLVFEWQRVKAVGEFTAAPALELEAAAIQFAEKKIARSGQVCVGQWVGRDEKYVYMTVGCAKFFQELGETKAEGDQNFLPTRFRYDEKEIEHWEQPNLDQFANSMRRLFPKEAMAALAGKRNADLYLKLGLARQASTAPKP